MLIRFVHWLLTLTTFELLSGVFLVILFLITVAAMMVVCWRGSTHIPDWPDQT